MRRKQIRPNDQPPAEARQAESADSAQPASSASYAQLARRIMRWSGNLLATAVILILGLTFGQQVLQWWHGDVPAPPATDPAAALQLSQLTDPDTPLTLSFGDMPYQLRRHVLVGDQDAALAALRRECRMVAEQTDPARATAMDVAPHVVQQLAQREAVEQGVGWRIVQNTGPVITVVALRQDARGTPDTVEPARQNDESVVSWGLGLRAVTLENNSSADQWTLYVCSGQDRRSAVDLLHIQLPPHAQRTFAVQVDGGGALVGFRSGDSAEATQHFFDTFFANGGWTRAVEWAQLGDAAHCRFQSLENTTCDVQLFASQGAVTGILTITTPDSNAEK